MAQRTDVRPGEATPAEPKRTPPWALLIAIAVAVAVLAPTVVYLTSREARKTAAVNVLETAVELRRKADSEFRAAEGSAQADVGDIVRTDVTGKAELQYWDGSFTRLAPSSSIEVKELVTTAGQRVGRTRLEEGRLWNRVSQLTSNRERYEVESPNALAAVRGTAFDVKQNPDGGFDYTVVDGEVTVDPANDEPQIVRANERLNVDENGQGGTIEHVPDAELAKDPWIVENIQRDEELGVASPGELGDDGSLSTPGPEPSASAAPPPPPPPAPRFRSGGGTSGPSGGGTQSAPGPTPRRDPFSDPFFADSPSDEDRDRDRDNDDDDEEEPTPDPTAPPSTPEPTPPPETDPPPVD